jgi:hypothetical protein
VDATVAGQQLLFVLQEIKSKTQIKPLIKSAILTTIQLTDQMDFHAKTSQLT